MWVCNVVALFSYTNILLCLSPKSCLTFCKSSPSCLYIKKSFIKKKRQRKVCVLFLKFINFYYTLRLFDSCFQFSVFLFYFPAFTNCLFFLAAFHSFPLILLCFDSKAASAICFEIKTYLISKKIIEIYDLKKYKKS